MLIENIRTLITMGPLHDEMRFSAITTQDLGIIKDGWLLTEGGKIKALGQGTPPAVSDKEQRIDAKGGLVMPGLVDCHTHPVYGGNRADEFCARLEGATYKEIAAQGGGIKRTVELTRDATLEYLTDRCLETFRTFQKHGVTTLEAKSGYGLSIESELKLLRAIAAAGRNTKQTISTTLLALHAVPKDQPSKADFIAEMTTELLPRVHQEGLAQWVDAFVEEGYFSAEEVREHFAAAKKLGFGIRVHADEFTNSKGAVLAAEFHAGSADHLECADEDGIKAMADAGVVAVILPGTSLYTGIPYTKAKPFIDAGCPIALATDYNPGSCQVDNLGLIATLGGLHSGLDMPQVIAAVTFVPARSLRLEHTKGALQPGMDADIIIYDYEAAEEWVANLGQKDPHTVIIGGERV